MKEYLSNFFLSLFQLFGLLGFFHSSLCGVTLLVNNANNGDLKSQLQLGIYYTKGEDKDLLKSYYWLKKAAKQNHPMACRYIARAHIIGHGTSKDLRLAKKWYLLAVRNGNNQSLVDLAKCSELGQIWTESLAWYKIADEMGNETVGDSILRVSKYLNDTEMELMPNLILHLKEIISSPPPQANKIQRIEKNKVVHLQMKDGLSYWGEALNNVPHGYGRARSKDGTSYQGEFKNGNEDGYGTSFNKSGAISYEGIWENGKPAFENSKTQDDIITRY